MLRHLAQTADQQLVQSLEVSRLMVLRCNPVNRASQLKQGLPLVPKDSHLCEFLHPLGARFAAVLEERIGLQAAQTGQQFGQHFLVEVILRRTRS